MTALARTLPVALIATALLSPLTCQKYANWLPNLGDKEKTEAAERALVLMGPKAIPPLAKLIDAWDTSTPRERERCLAILRVVNLLGEDAASLAPMIKQCGLQDGCPVVPDIADTLATLEPYAKDNAWHELFHQSINATSDSRGRAMGAFVRMVSRQRVRNRSSFGALKKTLAKDQFGAREVAAECMAKMGNKEAMDLLRQRLLDRDTKPSGWDQLRHNGWVVPLQDQFALRAGNALIELDPTDPRAAVGFANRALHHPHRSVRIDAVRRMAFLGPAASDAIPELMLIAASEDSVIALEALKVLGMAGKGVGEHLLAIDAIANQGEGTAARVAKGLAARLRAMGCEANAADADALANAVAFAKLDAALDGSPDAATIEQIATTAGMWPHLAARFRKLDAKTPKLILDLIARVGWLRSEEDRLSMQYSLAYVSGNHWKAPMMSSSTGGPGLKAIHYLTHARLQVDPASEPDVLVKLMADENPFVRQVAAELLAKCASDWAKDSNDYATALDALLDAATTAHPAKFKMAQGPNSLGNQNMRNTRAVQTAAAEALAGQTVPNNKVVKLLEAVQRSPTEATVVQAIENWALNGPANENEAVIAKLTRLANDKRETVAAAAKAAKARLQAK